MCELLNEMGLWKQEKGGCHSYKKIQGYLLMERVFYGTESWKLFIDWYKSLVFTSMPNNHLIETNNADHMAFTTIWSYRVKHSATVSIMYQFCLIVAVSHAKIHYLKP